MSATGPGQSLLLLLDVVALLDEQRIAYCVVGALAASVYGTVRATTDADALVSVSAARLGSRPVGSRACSGSSSGATAWNAAT
jgi:hypothetical protein